MGDIIHFPNPTGKKKAGNIFCREGHHKWEIVQEKQFDSRQGRLVTIYRCSRCQKNKTVLL